MSKYLSCLFGAMCMIAVSANGQIISSNLFLQGKYLEVGLQHSGAMGSSVNPPSSYHPHNSGVTLCGASTPLASVFDWGRDGWTTGTPPYMGDYTVPGTPWEEWSMQSAGTIYRFNSLSCTSAGAWSGYAVTPSALGPWVSTIGSKASAFWTGTVGTGSTALSVRKEHRVDTFGTALVVTVVIKNPNSTPVNDVYYMRACDPDNNQSWSGGSFSTLNTIVYQNDYYHRVYVEATATGGTSATGIPPAPYGLATKDCRAKALIFTSWPLSCTDLSGIYAGTASCLGTSYYGTNSTGGITGDIAIGLIYNLGNIPAYDSVTFSYAYVYSGSLGVDSAFPSPKMVINGVDYDSIATITVCAGTFGDTIPVSILYGTDRNWLHSHWSWSPARDTALLTDTGVVSGIIVPNLLGVTRTFTITGTAGINNCAQKSFVLTVVPSVYGPPTVADQYYCQGDFPTPVSAIGIDLLWYTSATGGTGSSTAPIPPTATPGTYTYHVTQSPCGVGYESARAAVHVYVTPRPVVTATSSGAVCAGYPFTLYAMDTFTRGAISYLWSGPGGFTSTLKNPVFPSAAASDSGLYTVTLTVNGCVSYPDTVVVVVHTAPGAPTVTNVTYCQFAPGVSALAATGANLLWYTTASGGTGTIFAPYPSVSTAGVVTYYVSQSTNGCEGPRAPLTVTVNAQPAPPNVVPPTYCQYDLPSALSATGSSLLWYGPGISASTIAPTPSTAVPGIDSYYVTQTVLGCVSNRSFDPVTVISKPAAPSTSNLTYCQTASAAQLTASGSNPRWYTTSAGGTALASAPTPSTAIVGTTSWYVSQTVNGCESDRTPLAVSILYQPVFTIDRSRPFTCQFDTLSFAYNGPSLTDAGYRWVLPNGASYVSGDTTSPNIVVRFDSLFFQHVTLTASDFNGFCQATDTLPVRVISEPFATAYVAPDVCAGDTILVALTSRATDAYQFTWDFNGASIITANSNSGGPYKVSWSDSGIKVLSVVAATEEGCLGKKVFDTVKVHALPNASIVPPNVSKDLCLEDSVFLSAVVNDARNSYTWTPAHFFHNNNRYEIWGKIELAGYVTLTVSDPFGCMAADSILFTPDACCTVLFPKGFTPNGDGRNDLFRPIFNGFHRFHDFRVVNRWGQTVFEGINSRMEWDGTFGGVPQDMGVYYYFIRYSCADGHDTKEHVEKGEVTLIR